MLVVSSIKIHVPNMKKLYEYVSTCTMQIYLMVQYVQNTFTSLPNIIIKHDILINTANV